MTEANLHAIMENGPKSAQYAALNKLKLMGVIRKPSFYVYYTEYTLGM